MCLGLGCLFNVFSFLVFGGNQILFCLNKNKALIISAIFIGLITGVFYRLEFLVGFKSFNFSSSLCVFKLVCNFLLAMKFLMIYQINVLLI